MAVTITLKQLRALRPCNAQLELFKTTFGDSVTFDTLEAFVTACQSHPFDYDWAATHLLALAARADYERVRDAAWADYERVRDAALADYDRVTAAARADYDRVEAAAFANAYWNQQHNTGA